MIWMYKLMLIDDEEEIRFGIRSVIDWSSHDIEICGEAANGVEALEKIEIMKPDIILVDIRMPRMDGMELLGALEAKGSHQKVIVLSSYDEFEYAKKAMSYGVKEYLLKPCRPEDIVGAVEKVVQEINTEKALSQKMIQMAATAKQGELLNRERQLIRLLDGQVLQPETIGALRADYKISDSCYLASIKVTHPSLHLGDDRNLELFCVRNVVQELLQTICMDTVIKDGEIVILCQCDVNGLNRTLLPELKHLQSYLHKKMKLAVSIGVSESFGGLSEIGQAYVKSQKALEKVFFFGDMSLIVYSDVLNTDTKTLEYPSAAQSELLTALFSGTIEDVKFSWRKYFGILRTQTPSVTYMFQCCSALLLTVHQKYMEKNISIDEQLSKNLYELISEENHTTAELLDSTILKLLTDFYDCMHKNQSGNHIINVCTKYIKEHYDEELTLEIVGEAAHISPGYLSQLFKQVMGVKFIDYIHTVRIDNACELLKDIGLRAYDIAPMVGYKTEKYFSKKFKAIKGMSPSEYRKKMMSI